MIETWRDVPGYKGLYQVSDMGNIKTLNWKNTGRIKISQGHKSDRGYLTYVLVKDGKTYKTGVHRLVYCTFNDIDFKYYNPFDKTLICHRDDNKTNNILENLFIGTARDNHDDMVNKGRRADFRGEKNSYSKLKNIQVYEIRNLLQEGKLSHASIGDMYGVSRSCITDINNNRTYNFI